MQAVKDHDLNTVLSEVVLTWTITNTRIHILARAYARVHSYYSCLGVSAVSLRPLRMAVATSDLVENIY